MAAVPVAHADHDWELGRRVRVAGGEVAYDVLGEGPAVVLTHGTPSWSYLWRNLATELAATHTVYLWDLLGYGDSALDPGVTPSIALHAATLAELAEYWSRRRPVLVGHDIGAGTVLRAHLTHGVPTRGLALLDAAVLTPWVTPVATHMQTHLDAYRTMPVHVFGEVIAAHLRTATHQPLAPATEQAYLGRFAGEAGRQRYLDQVAGFCDEDTRDVAAALGEISVPTLVAWGERDNWLSVETADELSEAISRSHRVVIPDAGHFLTEDAPVATAAVLRAFLERLL
jgi:pimeloyl-ACP methyl ester carboxylesterase